MIKKMFNITDNPSTPPKIAVTVINENNNIMASASPYVNNRHRCLSILLGNTLAGHDKIIAMHTLIINIVVVCVIELLSNPIIIRKIILY